jgi:uncharacterized membrane protein YidH (DUF202 family)
MKLQSVLRRNICLVSGTALGIITLLIPLQHFMTLGRYQHYGMAVFMFGLGYILHCIWTWRGERFWPRLCYALTGAFFCSVGLLFSANPWMDWNTSVQTEEKQLFRFALSGIYLMLGFALMIVWLITYVKTANTEKSPEKKLEKK